MTKLICQPSWMQWHTPPTSLTPSSLLYTLSKESILRSREIIFWWHQDKPMTPLRANCMMQLIGRDWQPTNICQDPDIFSNCPHYKKLWCWHIIKGPFAGEASSLIRGEDFYYSLIISIWRSSALGTYPARNLEQYMRFTKLISNIRFKKCEKLINLKIFITSSDVSTIII